MSIQIYHREISILDSDFFSRFAKELGRGYDFFRNNWRWILSITLFHVHPLENRIHSYIWTRIQFAFNYCVWFFHTVHRAFIYCIQLWKLDSAFLKNYTQSCDKMKVHFSHSLYSLLFRLQYDFHFVLLNRYFLFLFFRFLSLFFFFFLFLFSHCIHFWGRCSVNTTHFIILMDCDLWPN